MASTVNNLEKMLSLFSESMVWSPLGNRYISAKESGIEFFGRVNNINRKYDRTDDEKFLENWKDYNFDFISKRWFPDGEFIGKDVILDIYAINWYPTFIAKSEGILYLFDGNKWEEFTSFIPSEGKDPYGIAKYLNFLVKQI